MRRTVLSATATACIAVLASTVPAFADGANSSPTPRPVGSGPSARPSAPPSAEPSAVPTRMPGRAATPVPSVAPSEGHGQVGVVPSGAPDTGVVTGSAGSGSDGMLIGGSSAGALAVGGAVVFLVRRRRATGA
ncbi:Tat pathway signal sequence domain protein [Streptomyces sp. SID1328]|uniref:Tat pathway signal sequence domain protein n=1 Tax=Streptomyces sp. SID1328 TaxID=2690250 RepID=UPI00136E66F2|nr:Tat pathway signal sequence domain protein [Streptomyces sp. SID1328]MYV38342.1 Tat pathway signal sequence domain protein [Streptomyces sp. SID1328]